MVTLQFHSTDRSKSDTYLQCFLNTNNEIFIEIAEENEDFPRKWVCLDKDTAIKLAKELKKQISFIKEV